MHVCMYACICVCTYVCMYVCMYVYMLMKPEGLVECHQTLSSRVGSGHEYVGSYVCMSIECDQIFELE